MHFARRPEPHASEDPPVTTDDLVPRILAAINELEAAALAERDASADLHVITRPGAPQPTELEKLALKRRMDQEARERRRRANPAKALLEEQGDWDVVLRRCAADRKLIALHPQDPELGWLCQLCGGEGQNIDCTYPCDTLRLVADSYGVAPATEPANRQGTSR